eukprot:223597_1
MNVLLCIIKRHLLMRILILGTFQIQYDNLAKLRRKPNAKGLKHHWLVHVVEWCEYYRWSPSWVDDQRQEAIHGLIKYYAHRYRKYTPDGLFEEMIKSMNNCTFNHC